MLVDLNIKWLVICLYITIIVPNINSQCNNPNYIIPSTYLDTIFDTTFNNIRSSQNLINAVSNPSQQTLKAYFLSVLPIAAPLFAIGALVLVFFIIFIIQICCFKICKNRKCGNEINSTTYSPTPIKIMTITFIVLVIAIILFSIAAIVINSGLIQSLNYVNCNAKDITNQAYQGNTNKITPWSGINNFNTFINMLSVNFQNAIPILVNYFSNTNPAYANINDTSTTNTAYNQSQTYICATPPSSGISCPFFNTVNCPNGNSNTATFAADFCSNSTTGSSQNLINNQMQQNSTKWLNNIRSLSSNLASLNSNISTITSLATTMSSFTNSVLSYQSNLNSVFDLSGSSISALQISLYAFYALVIFFGIVSLIDIIMFYYCLRFSFKVCIDVWWIIFTILALIFFACAGVLVTISVMSFDTCSAYGYYFSASSSTNFKQLNFANQTSGKILFNCFFGNSSQTIFTGFSDNPGAQSIINLATQYTNAQPSSTFSSVVTQIQSTLFNYTLFPQTVNLVGQTSVNTPLQAYNSANLFANSKANGSSQTCNLTQDILVFNPSNCYPSLSVNTPPNPSCILLGQTATLPPTISARQTLFTGGCSGEGTTYVNNANALNSFGFSINTLINSMTSNIPNPNNPLQAYQTKYYNYYTAVNDFFTSPTTQQFLSFLQPYNQLNANASCAFLTTSTNSFTDITCNQLFPYINSLTIINIVLAVLLFFAMVLLYFLSPRYQFYMYLEGNYSNIGVSSKQINQQIQLTNRQQTLIPSINQ